MDIEGACVAGAMAWVLLILDVSGIDLGDGSGGTADDFTSNPPNNPAARALFLWLDGYAGGAYDDADGGGGALLAVAGIAVTTGTGGLLAEEDVVVCLP